MRLMKRRDKKESEIFTYELRIKQVEVEKYEVNKQFEERKRLYQIWKTENKVEGIKY